MSIDFQPAIFDFLSQRRSIDLPGLGRLQWRDMGVTKDETSQQLIPPAIHLQFSKQSESNDAFLDYLSVKLGVPFSDVKSMWQEWIREVETQLKEGGRYMIQHVGTFSKGRNSSISFVPDASFQNGSFYLTALNPDMVVKETVSEEPEDVEIEDEINWQSAFLTAITLLFLIGAIVIVSRSIISYLASEGSAVESVQKPENNMQLTTPVFNDTSKYVETLSGLPEEEYIEEAIDSIEYEEQLDQLNERSCIIIVGSFKNLDYAATVETEIRDLGFNLYTEDYNGYKRVGVAFDCLTQDLYRTLFQLKGRFGEDAWILKYEK